MQLTRIHPPPEMIGARRMTALPNEMIENMVVRFISKQDFFHDYVPEAASIYVLVEDKVRVLNLTYGTLCDPSAKRQTGGTRQVFVVGKVWGQRPGTRLWKSKERK